jgi:acyl carrier protein
VSTVEHRAKLILANELESSQGQLAESLVLKEIPGLDSLKLVEIVMSLEDEFDTLMPDHEVENLNTVEDLIALCESKVTQKSTNASKPR